MIFTCTHNKTRADCLGQTTCMFAHRAITMFVWCPSTSETWSELLQVLCVCTSWIACVACHRKRMHASYVCTVRMCMNQCVWVLAFIIIHKATQKWSGTSPWSGEIRRQSVARKRQNLINKVHSLRVTFQCQVDQWDLQRNNVFQWNTLSTLSRNKERRREWERIQWILARPVKVKQRNFVGYRQDWLDFEKIKVCTHLHPISLKKKKKKLLVEVKKRPLEQSNKNICYGPHFTSI